MAKRKSSKLKLWIRRKKRALAKSKASRKPRKVRTMDVALVVVASALLAFTIEMITLYKETGMIPDTLCTCVFSALGGECGAMAFIKIAKERKQDRKWMEEDREREEQRQQAAESEETDEH